MSVNGLPVPQAQNRVMVHSAIPLVAQRNLELSGNNLQQQQTTVSGKSYYGTSRVGVTRIPERINPFPTLQLDPAVFAPPAMSLVLQHFNAVHCHHLERLRNLFPEVNPTILKNVLVLCQGNFIRTVDNLLYIQACEQKHRITAPVPMYFPVTPTQVAGVSNGHSSFCGNYGNMWQAADNIDHFTALPNFQLSQKPKPGFPYQNVNIVKQPQQILRVPTYLPPLEYLQAESYLPQLPSYTQMVKPYLKSKGSFISSQQGTYSQQLTGTHQNLEVLRVMSNVAECKQTPGDSVDNLPAPLLHEHYSLQDDQENKPVKYMSKCKGVTLKQCRKSLVLIQADKISDKQKSVLSCIPQKRPYLIQDEVKYDGVGENKKVKVLENLPCGSVESKEFPLPDSSQEEYPHMTAGIEMLPELLQPTTICHPERAVGITDKYSSTAQSHVMMKSHPPRPGNENTETEDTASDSYVEGYGSETECTFHHHWSC